MTFNRTIHAQIGRWMIAKHPEMVEEIVRDIPALKRHDLGLTKSYFLIFSQYSGVPTCHMTGAAVDRSKVETSKVFIGAMVRIYGNQRLLNKTLADLLDKKESWMSIAIDEVRTRASKEKPFKESVESFLSHIHTQETHD